MGEYSGMKRNSSKIKVLFALVAFFILASLSAFAQDNVISSVVISKSKDKPNAFELSIDSTQAVQYKSHIDSDGNVYFDLKNSSLAPDMGTIYDDVSDVDNVVVKQLDKNKVRIYVSGKDARNTELIFINSLFETSKESSKKIIVNRPINEYKPTSANSGDLEEYVDDVAEWDDNSFNLSHLSTIILSELKNGISGKVLILLLLFAIAAILIKALSSKIAQDKEPLIGLNSSKYMHDIKNTQNLQKSAPNFELPDVSKRNETLKQAQAELNRAHEKYRQYIQNKYQGAQKPKSIDVDAIKKSIALNQYQKSTQNPYKDQQVIKLNKGFSNEIASEGKFQIPPRPKMAPKKEFSSPYIKKTNNFINTDTKKDEPKTNMRFLESVTKIYERSGRGDLASELKNSISKAKQTI